MVNRQPTPREQRREAVLSAVCTLVEEPATLQGGLLTLLAPFTADELLQAAEERALANLCGNPTCSDDPYTGRKALSRLRGPVSSDPNIERLLDGICCSEACAVATQRLADGLGKEEQALLRWEVVRRREGQKGANSGPLGRAKPKARKPDFAAGSQQAPIMLADIKERDPTVKAAPSSEDPSAEQAPGSTEPSDAVEGYVPRHPKVSADGAKKVRFAPSAKQAASSPQPRPADPGLPGATLDAFLRGRHECTPEAFDIIPIPANPADPKSPSIEDLLDQAQALRPTQPFASPVQPTSVPPQQAPSEDASHASAGGQPQSMPNLALNGHQKQQIKPALRKVAPQRSQVRQAGRSDSEDGSVEGSEMDDRWDDYGVVDDAHLEGHSSLAGPSLHPREVDGSAADLDPFTQQDSVKAGARSAPTLHHQLQPGRRPDSQQGPVVERRVDAEAGTAPGTTMANHSQPARGLQDEGNAPEAAASDSNGNHSSAELRTAGGEDSKMLEHGSGAHPSGQPQIMLDIDLQDGASMDDLADAVGRLKVSSGEEGVDDVEGAEWNEDADAGDPGSDGSEADSADQLLNEDLGREGADSDVEADATAPDVQSDYSPWLSDPPIGARALSGFGQMFNQLDTAVTQRTQSFLQPSLHAPPSPDSPLDSMPTAGAPWNRSQVQQALHLAVSRALPRVMRNLHIQLPRSALERSLYPALETMHFPAGLPAFTEAQWQILVLLLLKGLSLEKLPMLQPAFESREGVAAVQGTLEQLGTHLEEFHALMDILLIAD